MCGFDEERGYFFSFSTNYFVFASGVLLIFIKSDEGAESSASSLTDKKRLMT
jgi:hypothetical protein